MENRYGRAYRGVLSEIQQNKLASDIEQSAIQKEAFLQLEIKYTRLQSAYEQLQSQFRYLQEEAVRKISDLDQQTGLIIQQKDVEIQRSARQVKELESQNYALQLEKDKIQRQTACLHKQLGDLERDVRDQTFQQERTIKILQQQASKLQILLQQRTHDLGLTKTAFSKEHQKALLHQELADKRQHQTEVLRAQLNEMKRVLSQKALSETEVWDCNYILRRQVEELKDMFSRTELNMRNCEGCFVLERQNSRLNQQMEGFAVQCLNSKREAQKRTRNILADLEEAVCENSWLKRELDQVKGGIEKLRHHMDHKDHKESFPRATMKESIIERCKNIIDSRHSRV